MRKDGLLSCNTFSVFKVLPDCCRHLLRRRVSVCPVRPKWEGTGLPWCPRFGRAPPSRTTSASGWTPRPLAGTGAGGVLRAFRRWPSKSHGRFSAASPPRHPPPPRTTRSADSIGGVAQQRRRLGPPPPGPTRDSTGGAEPDHSHALPRAGAANRLTPGDALACTLPSGAPALRGPPDKSGASRDPPGLSPSRTPTPARLPLLGSPRAAAAQAA